MKSMPGLSKLVQHLADYVEVFGIEVESEDTKLKVYRSVVLPTLLYACETWTVYQRHAKRLKHFHKSCLKKTSKDQVARQDSRHRSPEKGRDEECTYSSEIGTDKMNRPCYQNAWWTFAKDNPLWSTTSQKNEPMVVRRSDTRTPSKKGKRKVQGEPQSQTAALSRHLEEEETDKTKQVQIEQTYEKH